MILLCRTSAKVRFYCTKNLKKYTETINLPRTKFPNRLSAAKREETERNLLQQVFAGAYAHQLQHNQEPTYVLHDGPPYANGSLHMGHAVNKILKDISLRKHAVRGQRVHYVPGWDCHGLPIELKAMAAHKSNSSDKEALCIRQQSREFALAAVQQQKSEFASWGILADWQNANNLYLTLSAAFITNQLRLFDELYEQGLIYRDLKAVYWSPSSRTALAEAELEYDAHFVSPSVHVRFLLTKLPQQLSAHAKTVYALVWTTTPWTLPSNQAICYNANLEYALVQLQSDANALYLIATCLLSDFERNTKQSCQLLQTIAGNALQDCTYQHPIDAEQQTLPFFAAPHVTDSKGTGLVHTAPAHGPEDFLICLREQLPVHCYVDEAGVYTSQAPAFLQGKQVLLQGNDLVLQHIAADVVHAGSLTHAYAIDWRTKQPVIVRASEQWFINTQQLKERAAQQLQQHVQIYPRAHAEASRKALLTQVLKRPYWCISRQRAWGVPIPVFYDKHSKQVVTHKKLTAHICQLTKANGNIDFWWSQNIAQMLPTELLQQLNLNAADLLKGTDIFDIWFDSGSSWSSVLPNNKVADLYLEGYDQFTGWFQSSLLTSVAARNHAPYKALFVHGFTVDEKGHKMSKSLGNVIAPKQIIKKYGVDVLRWWIASHATQHMSITVSDKLLQQAADSLAKIRSTFRYLNGVIDRASDIKTNTDNNIYLNKYLLSRLVDFDMEIQTLYDNYEYNRVTAVVQNFVANQISAEYLHLIKDRLYCGDDESLQNIKYTLARTYEVLCKALWPITPFLVEESWSHYADAGFHRKHIQLAAEWKNAQAEQVINTALLLKRLINQKTGDMNSRNLAINVQCHDVEQLKLLQQLHAALDVPLVDTDLCEILQFGSVNLQNCANVGTTASAVDKTAAATFVIEVQPLNNLLCARCRRFAVDSADCVCDRCANVLKLKDAKSVRSL